MHFDFDTVIERRGTGNVKFGLAEADGYPADILPLWVADMDFQAPPCVIEALHKRVELACPRTTLRQAMENLRKALA